MQYEPTLESVSQHPLPAWYDDAKFGIFVHWTPSCIPAFAPVHEDIAGLYAKHGEMAIFANSPYAEWYLNSLQMPNSPVAIHHMKTYGSNYPYDKFVACFNETILDWQPSAWGELFEQAHARYAVLVTKHHDGFTLFQSNTRNPHKPDWHANRDIVAEFAEEVRCRHLRMGLYYSGLIDWSFYHRPITDFLSLAASGSPKPAYANYVDAHYRELIDRFHPDILWNDIGYPSRSNVFALFAEYYNRMPDGVVNDRWLQTPQWVRMSASWSPTRRLLRRLMNPGGSDGGIEPPKPPHFDYTTPEYTVKKEISTRKWECVRGIGKSFGFNAEERPEDYLSETELVHLLIDIVSKNGNLLLNIGPKPDGTVPQIQVDRLVALGKWLEVNGDGIFATRPWKVADAKSTCGIDVRLTCKENELFVFVLGKPVNETIEIPLNVTARNALGQIERARLMGSARPVEVAIKDSLSIRTSWLDTHTQAISLATHDRSTFARQGLH